MKRPIKIEKYTPEILSLEQIHALGEPEFYASASTLLNELITKTNQLDLDAVQTQILNESDQDVEQLYEDVDDDTIDPEEAKFLASKRCEEIFIDLMEFKRNLHHIHNMLELCHTICENRTLFSSPLIICTMCCSIRIL